MREGLSYYEATAYGGMEPDGDAGHAQNAMLDAANQHDFAMLKDWWLQARTAQAAGRYEMAIDEDYYDGLQWAEEDQLEVESRGQPALAFNQVKPVVDWIIGTERRAKWDWNILPRTEGDRPLAEVKTKLLKYTDDVNHTQFHRSRAFVDAVKAGLGWLEDGVKRDPTDEPVYSRYESWRNIWYDHLHQEPDLSDARYLFRAKWVDVDIACAYFPEHTAAIKAAAQTNDMFGGSEEDDTYAQLYFRTDEQGRPLPRRAYTEDVSATVSNRRQRVRLVEAWYRKPSTGKVVHYHDPEAPNAGRFEGERASNDPDLMADVEDGVASLYDAIRMDMWCAIFIEGTLLQNARSGYKHDKFPFTPIWGYRRKRDGTPYGVVRNMRDPQQDLNKRRSKALHILSTKQVIAEENAVEDIDEAREEVASPDGWITVRPNKRFEFHTDVQVADANFKMEIQDREYIRESGGVTSENLGHQTNATSGKAIEARQTEGAAVTTELFDNAYFAGQLQGEKRLSVIEQFVSAPKIVRLTTDEGSMEFLKVNALVANEAGEPTVENDITASKADFVIDRVDWRATVREAMFAQLVEMVGNIMSNMGEAGAQAAFQLMDLVFEMADIPHKDAIVARIRKLNGQPDPAQEGTPEAEEAQQAKEQAEAEANEIQRRAAMAEVDLAEQKALRERAAAAREKQQAIQTAVQSLQASAEVGAAIQVTPEIAALMDELLQFVNEQIEPPPAAVAPQQAA